MGIRRTIGRIGVRSALFGLCHNVRHLAARELRILAYHRVIDPAHAFDPENVSANLENFDWQMGYVKANYDVITLAELVAAKGNPAALPKRPAIITFDDGFADNYFNAFPILQRHKLSALFSVITSMIDQQEMFWFDRAACLANRLGEGSLLHAGQFSRTIINAQRPSVTKELLQHLKDLPDASRMAQMEEIDEQLQDCMPGMLELAPHYPLNWQQICIMSEAGMEIGSHSHSHPILSQLEDTAAVEAELITSRAIIEAKTSKDCIVIAYPEGLDYAIDARVIAACESAGYSVGLTSMRGVNKLPITKPYQLERIQIHHSNDHEIFIGSLQFPEIVV